MSTEPDTELKQLVHDYIYAAKWAPLAIVREDGSPTMRPIGAFAPVASGELDIYFLTRADTAKVRALRSNPRVSFFFEHGVENIAAYKAVSLIGEATEVAPDTPEHTTAVAVLAARSPYVKGLVERNELAGSLIFRIRTSEVRYSDYAAQEKMRELKL
ncbi:MAG: pyridoxamine 5'-phosphate oxidase family protein [Puniceicoccales bacterium]|jgi:nitroimidazol reductase NimA-like FMN-containing flavoprotein (pyridoxamine 5'-phosphate oxidase superfamily)|nr:pyridoxamine 5'-phosphate oxidase family protein [Puniceicoccales bacterium]